MPDLEAVCGAAIRAQGYRTFSSVPAKPVYPLLVVQRLGGVPVERHRLDMARIQVDAWGDNKAQARDAAEAARRAILELEGTKSQTFSAVITGCDDELGLMWLPDPDTGRDRYIFAVLVYGHHLDA